MVLFRTKFMVDSDCDIDAFISFFIDNCLGTYELNESYNNETEFETSLKNDLGSFHLLREDVRVSFRLNMIDDTINIIDTCVYDNDKHLLFVERVKESQESLLNKFCSSTPTLINPFFWGEYGGIDGDLLTDNRALILRKNNVELGQKLFSGKLEFINPVVYVSCFGDTGNYSVNYDFLASDLAGMAHVIVEGSPVISNMLSNVCPEYKVSKGSVSIFFPSGECEVFKPNDNINLNTSVRKHISKILINTGVPDGFNFDKIRERFVLNKLKSLSENNELSQIYEDILSDKDKELSDLKAKISDLEHENSNLKYKCVSIQSNMDNFKDANDVSLGLNITESDLYVGEVKDVVLKLVQKEYNLISSDKNTKLSRKACVLKDILDNNTLSGKDDEIKAAFKSALGDGDMTPSIISDLERIGFNVTLNDRKHYKLIFNNDGRFKTFVPSTRSDYRGLENTVSVFMNTLFGF